MRFKRKPHVDTSPTVVEARFLYFLLWSILALGATRAFAQTLSDKDIATHLSTAQHLVDQGIPDTAIRDHLDPVIAFYRSQHTHFDQKVYSAHSRAEALIYLAMDTAMSKEDGAAAPEKVRVLNGSWSDALQLKGYALVELQRFEDAKTVLKEEIDLAPMNSAPWSELGNIYQNEKNWTEALAAYEHAENAAEVNKEEDPHRPLYTRALRGKAFVYTDQGKLNDSEALYRQCLTLNADDSNAQYELAYIAGLRAKHQSTHPSKDAGQDASSPPP